MEPDEEDALAAANAAAQGGLIKLFVGQIPKTWEEEDIREILEPHGSIRELTVLKDKLSGTHKGWPREALRGGGYGGREAWYSV